MQAQHNHKQSFCSQWQTKKEGNLSNYRLCMNGVFPPSSLHWDLAIRQKVREVPKKANLLENRKKMTNLLLSNSLLTAQVLDLRQKRAGIRD